ALCFSKRQSDDEGCSFAYPIARNCNRTAVKVNDFPDDREAEAQSDCVSFVGSPALLKPVEHKREELPLDTLSGIGHNTLNCAVAPADPQRDRPPLRREFHGVIQ